MASQQDTNFAVYAGQLVANGVRPNAPLIPLEGQSNQTVLDNLTMIGSLMPKVSDVIFRETRIFDNPLDPYFRKFSAEYGAAIEQAEFEDGATNKKNAGRCVPRGDVDVNSQLNIQNFAYDIEVQVKDREINMAVMNAQQAGSYVAQKLRTPLKRISSLKYTSQKQLIGDIVDGTRSIVSTDGDGNAVTYSVTCDGYCGVVESSNVVLAEIALQSTPAFASGADATTVIKKIQSAARDMKTENTTYNVLGNNTFVLGKPLLIMESKTLDALDNALALDGTDKRVPTRSGRQYLTEDVGVEIVEIDAFPAMPTNANYSNERTGAVLIDRDSLTEHLRYADVEAQRCASQRLTGYSFQSESTLSIYRGAPAYALTFDTQ